MLTSIPCSFLIDLMSQPNTNEFSSEAAFRTAQNVASRMLRIIEDAEATEADRRRACNTIREALRIPGEGVQAPLTDSREQYLSGFGRDESVNRYRSQELRFWDSVQLLMKSRNITQAQLAERLGTSQPSVSQMLSRRCRPQRSTIMNIAGALGVSPQELWADLDVTDILDSVAAFQEEHPLSDQEADAIRKTLERDPADAPAAPLPKWKR